MKKISNNDLFELSGLLGRITSLIGRDYCHVSDHLPKPLIDSLHNYSVKIDEEIDSRQSED